MAIETETDGDGRIAPDSARGRADGAAPQWVFDGEGRQAEIRPIPGYPSYFVDSLGGVYSTRITKYPTALTPSRDRDGYLRVNIRDRGIPRRLAVHQMVARAFLREPIEGEEVRHANGKRDDNRLENLSWGTHQDNMEDRRAHGNNAVGTRNGRAIVNEDQVREIRRRAAAGERHANIAAAYGLRANSVASIIYRKNWKHVA